MPTRKATPDFHSIIKQVASDYHTKLVSQGIGADDPIEWIQTEFYIPERAHEKNKAMQLAPHQIAVLQEAYRKDSRGKFVYDVICWSDIKKSGKSSVAAAVLLERARRTEWGTFKIVANDLKQADSRVFYYIRRAIEMNPRLSAIANISNYKITLPNKSIIEAIPVDPKGEAGGNDDFIEFTELHAATSKAAHKMWTELTLSPLKAGYSQRWIDTYAGFTGESPILEPIYEQCVRRENLIDLGIPDLEVYRKGKILCYWNTQPRLEWQTPEYYASEAQVLSPNEFARVHRNQWVTSVEQFVPPEWWYACEKPSLPPLDRWRQVVVALDAAVSDDCFGMIAVSRDDDRITVRFVRAWYPNNGKITFSNPDDPNDLSTPEGQLRQLAKDYNVVGVVYDPTQLHDFCTRLRHDNVAGFREFNQNITRLIADKQLRDLIRERRIIHSGDVTLTEHINNANAKADTEDSKLRIVKRTQGAKIDLAVCLSMASYHALRVLT